jgi:phosphoenolpyruvate carboxylase
VFSWAQSRHGIPGWFGLGAALAELEQKHGLLHLQELYRSWPFFAGLLDNAQLALARADMDVAEYYARLAGPDAADIFATIRDEYRRTCEHLLAIIGSDHLLAAWPTIAGTVARRNPDVDVLSHVQVELMARLRAAAPADRARLRAALFVTINGIAAGLQSAG